MQAASEVAHPGNTLASPRPTKTDQRTVFYASRKQGNSIAASARVAGVSRATGMRWEKAANATDAEQKARGLALATKTELGEVLSSLIRNAEVAPRDKVAAVKTHAELMGLNAAIRTESIVINASVAQWIEHKRLEDVARAAEQRTIDAGGEPPTQAAAESLSPSPNIPQNSTKDPK